jgi:hypothetical protein
MSTQTDPTDAIRQELDTKLQDLLNKLESQINEFSKRLPAPYVPDTHEALYKAMVEKLFYMKGYYSVTDKEHEPKSGAVQDIDVLCERYRRLTSPLAPKRKDLPTLP